MKKLQEDLYMGGNAFLNLCPHCEKDMRCDND